MAYIRKGTEQGCKWGLHDVEGDNRGMDETWIHLYNEDRSDYRTVVIGIEEAVDIVENAFENSVHHQSRVLTEAMKHCEALRKLLREVYHG